MNILWTTENILEALDDLIINCGTIIAKANIYDIVIDSREITANSLFIGISGENYNGSNFALQAMENSGAVLCIVDVIPTDIKKEFSNRLILVKNTYDALIRLATYSRSKFLGTIIGITGSSGKTTAKEMLNLVLSKSKNIDNISNDINVFASVGNKNNTIGLPLMLCKLPAHYDFGIFEMGMSAAGEISILSKIAKPHISLILNIMPVHIEFFDSVKAIALAKSEIFYYMEEGHGISIINYDDKYCDVIEQQADKKNLKKIFFGKKNTNETEDKIKLLEKISRSDKVQLLNYKTHCNEDGEKSVINILYKSKKIQYIIPLAGEHFVYSSLAVFAILSAINIHLQRSGDYLKKNINPEIYIKNLENFSGLNGRGKILYLKDNIIVIDDSYNANPESVRAALRRLSYYKNNNGIMQNRRLIAILGDMKELGGDSINMHCALFDDIMKCNIDEVFTVGNMMKNLFDMLDKPGLAVDDSGELADNIAKYIHPYDVILIKGSFSMKMQKIVDALKS